MRKSPLARTRLSSLLTSLAMLPVAAHAATLVDLSATSLPLGPVTTWTNNGTIGGSFAANGTPQVVNVAGYRTVNLAGGSQYFTGPAAPAEITGANKPVTVEAWVMNPNIPGEETVVAWGRRGGGDGTNASYNYGNDARWGAVGHWGSPDMGWIDQDITVGAPAANAWHYLVWTFDGTTERLYSDGVPMHFESKSLNIWATSTTGAALPIRIGAQNLDNGGVAQFNDGINILRVRIKDSAMTPSEIASNYTTEKAGLDATIVAAINSFTASPTQFAPGEGVTLTWNLSNTTNASIDNGVGAVSTTGGTLVLNPTAQTTYTLTASNANGSTSSSVTVRPYSRPINTHRWSFNEGGTGTTVIDSVAGANGIIKGVNGSVFSGNGLWERTATEVKLGGGPSGSSAYIDLPNGLISPYTSMTLEGWMTLNSNQNWGRVFDFGTSSIGEVNAPGGGFSGTNYIVLTSQVGGDQNFKRLELLPGGGTLDINDPVVQGQPFHFAVVYDAVGNSGQPQVRYYKNGILKGSLNSALALNSIADVNNWLGRSNWSGDNNTDGSYDEFRIWSGALREQDVVLSYNNGPDAATLPPTVPPEITTFSTSVNAFAPGEPVTLAWNIVGNPTTASIDQGVGPVAASGTVAVNPTAATTYTISASNTYGTSTKQVTVRPLHLAHRWTFNESASSTTVKDKIGTAHGTVLGTPGAVFTGNGLWERDGRSVSIGGGDSHFSAYVDLPNGLISPLTDATIEGWAVVRSPQAWGRLFDFGTGEAGELFGPGGDAQGTNYLILSAQIGTDQNLKRLEYNNGGFVLDINDPVVQGQAFHYAVVYDSKGTNGSSPKVSYYRDGVLVASASTARPLSAVQDVNNWLGRSNWTADANLDGSFDEFRIWDTPLSAAHVAASRAAGPDALPFAPTATAPLSFSSAPSVNRLGGNEVSMNVQWNATVGRSYIVEYSNDLVTWFAARDAATGDALIAPATSANSSAVAAIPPGTQRIYVRVRDISNP